MGKRYRHISLEERDRIAEMKSLGHTVKWTNNGSSEHTATSGDKCKEDIISMLTYEGYSCEVIEETSGFMIDDVLITAYHLLCVKR